MKTLSHILTTLSTLFLGWLMPAQMGTVTEVETANYEEDTDSSAYQENLIELDGQNYRVSWTTLELGTEVRLQQNLSEPKGSRGLYAQDSCQALINGGFYSEENTPIGLLQLSETEIISKYSANSLFDTVIFTDENRVVLIQAPFFIQTDSFALQTGPRIIFNGEPRKLNLKNDKLARRSFLGLNSLNQTIIGMITLENNDFSGPELDDMPSLLSLWSEQSLIDLQEAVNLDGGKASAFITPAKAYTEIAPIGSYFCFK